jgi:hypothetical protein
VRLAALPDGPTHSSSRLHTRGGACTASHIQWISCMHVPSKRAADARPTAVSSQLELVASSLPPRCAC